MKKLAILLLVATWIAMPVTAMEVTQAEKDLQPDPSKGIEDAVILLKEGTIDDTFTTTLSKINYRMRMKIFTRKGVEDWGTVKIVFNPQFDNVGDIEAWVWNPDGSVHELDKDDIHKKKLSREWGRKRTEISFALPGVTEGSIIEYSYYRSSMYRRYIDNVFNWYNQYEIYCLKSDVTFVAWPNSRWGFTGGNLHARPQVDQVRYAGNKAVQCVLENIPPLPKEEYAPPYNSVREYVTFYYRDVNYKFDDYWKDRGAYEYKQKYRKWMKKCGDTKRIVKNELRGLTKGNAIQKCYNYVVSHYTSLDLMSKEQEAELFDRAYIKKLIRADDVKDMVDLPYLFPEHITAILASMLDAAVPEAKVSFVEYAPWNRKFFNNDLHTMEQFTDSMLKVELDGKVQWLAPAKGMLPAGKIEYGAYEVPLLVMGPDGAQFEQLSVPSGDDIITDVDADIYLEEDRVRFKRKTTYDPYESYEKRTDLLYYTGEEIADLLKEDLEEMYGESVELISQQVINLKDIDKPLIIEEEFAVPIELDEMGDRIFFKMIGMSRYVRNPFNADKRHAPIMFPYPGTIKQSLTYHLPAYFAVESLPKSDSVSTPAMDYAVNIEKVDDHTFKVKTKEKLKANMFSSKGHWQFRKLFNRILSMSSPKAVLTELD